MITNPTLAIALGRYGEPLRIPRGAVILSPGENADGIYIVSAGTVKVQLLDINGVPIWSRSVAEGAILGLPAALGEHPHGVLATASDDLDVIFLRSSVLADVIRRNGSIGAQVVGAVSEELADLRRKVAMLKLP